jgi:hypothetical protein
VLTTLEIGIMLYGLTVAWYDDVELDELLLAATPGARLLGV